MREQNWIGVDERRAAVYPVPQNALYVCAGMNVLKFPKGKPQSQGRKSVVRGLRNKGVPGFAACEV